MSDYDLIILGGAWVGLSAALGFAKQGRRVALIEPRTLPDVQDRLYALRPHWRCFFSRWQVWPDSVLCLRGMRVFGDRGGHIAFDGDCLAWMVFHNPMINHLHDAALSEGVTIIQACCSDMGHEGDRVWVVVDGRTITAPPVSIC